MLISTTKKATQNAHYYSFLVRNKSPGRHSHIIHKKNPNTPKTSQIATNQRKICPEIPQNMQELAERKSTLSRRRHCGAGRGLGNQAIEFLERGAAQRQRRHGRSHSSRHFARPPQACNQKPPPPHKPTTQIHRREREFAGEYIRWPAAPYPKLGSTLRPPERFPSPFPSFPLVNIAAHLSGTLPSTTLLASHFHHVL